VSRSKIYSIHKKADHVVYIALHYFKRNPQNRLEGAKGRTLTVYNLKLEQVEKTIRAAISDLSSVFHISPSMCQDFSCRQTQPVSQSIPILVPAISRLNRL